jgi:hypothetical protein
VPDPGLVDGCLGQAAATTLDRFGGADNVGKRSKHHPVLPPLIEASPKERASDEKVDSTTIHPTSRPVGKGGVRPMPQGRLWTNVEVNYSWTARPSERRRERWSIVLCYRKRGMIRIVGIGTLARTERSFMEPVPSAIRMFG